MRSAAYDCYFFYWQEPTASCAWSLCYELRTGNYKQVRILTLVADEGSTGWALYQFLANRVRLRVLFVRDPFHRLSQGRVDFPSVWRPAHSFLGLLSLASVRGAFSFRLSNLFTNGLRSVLPVMNAVLQMTTIIKYMRAPYGSGRFWSELKDTLRIFLKVARLGEHPLMDQFAADIANDHGFRGDVKTIRTRGWITGYRQRGGWRFCSL